MVMIMICIIGYMSVYPFMNKNNECYIIELENIFIYIHIFLYISPYSLYFSISHCISIFSLIRPRPSDVGTPDVADVGHSDVDFQM